MEMGGQAAEILDFSFFHTYLGIFLFLHDLLDSPLILRSLLLDMFQFGVHTIDFPTEKKSEKKKSMTKNFQKTIFSFFSSKLKKSKTEKCQKLKIFDFRFFREFFLKKKS